jgi:small subunit ribosomal protein S8
MRHDLLADAFNIIKNSESMGIKECEIPASNLIRSILNIMQDRKYIGKFEFVQFQGGRFKVELAGRINNCNVIKPRFSVGKSGFIKWEKRFLPAHGLGILILTTPKGVMDQEQAKKEGTGGQLLGYVY